MVVMLRRALSLILLCAGFSFEAKATELDGFWMDSHGEVVLQVEPCLCSYRKRV